MFTLCVSTFNLEDVYIYGHECKCVSEISKSRHRLSLNTVETITDISQKMIQQ